MRPYGASGAVGNQARPRTLMRRRRLGCALLCASRGCLQESQEQPPDAHAAFLPAARARPATRLWLYKYFQALAAPPRGRGGRYSPALRKFRSRTRRPVGGAAWRLRRRGALAHGDATLITRGIVV